MTDNPDDNTQVSPATDPAAEASGPDEGAALDLPAQLKRAETEADELRDAFLRAKAETDNARRVAQNDVAKAHKYAIERFAQELLGVKDALELTLATPNAKPEALRDGVALTLKNLEAAFDKANIVEINRCTRNTTPSPPGDDHDRFGRAAGHRGPGIPKGLSAQRSRLAAGIGGRGQGEGKRGLNHIFA
jgi:molecular chaperone GrpE (heat shock protein)